MPDPLAREFLLTFWKIHILHHAGDGGVYGQWMLEELARHGYRLSPGTLYPMLARLERHGWLRSTEPARSTAARAYRLTPAGRKVMAKLRVALSELAGEMRPAAGGRQRAERTRQKAHAETQPVARRKN